MFPCLRRFVALAVVSPVAAAPLEIQRTPVLTASLPAGSTWQVESSEDGGPWTPVGVLAPGSSATVAVRLDGLPADAAYRWVKIGAADIVLPVVTSGLHLRGTAAGAPVIAIESSPDLGPASWPAVAFSFPDAAGGYLRILRPPLAPRSFFRASEPASPPGFASIASYNADPNSGYSGFGPVADDMPPIYQNGFIAALCPDFYHRGGQNAAAAGECYELVGPVGSTTVIAGDIDTAPPVGTCDAGRAFLNVGAPAFQIVTGQASGQGTVSYRPVPAPVSGPVKLLVLLNISNAAIDLRPYNHRAAVSKLEIRAAGSSTWIDLPRSVTNRFSYSGAAIAFPLDVRVTSRFGEVVTFPPVATMTANDRISATAQFGTFPDLGLVPVWVLPPIYTDSLSPIPGDAWTPAPYGDTTVDPAFTGAAYEGTASLRIQHKAAFGGLNLIHSTRFQRPGFGTLRFAIRGISSNPAGTLGITIGGFDLAGAAASSATVALPSLDGNWRIIRIPLEAAGAPVRIASIRIANLTNASQPAFLIDSMSVLQP